jgi:hypothetical protein
MNIEIDEVNKKRKFEQMECFDKLSLMEKKWKRLTKSNQDLKSSVLELKDEVKKFKKEE